MCERTTTRYMRVLARNSPSTLMLGSQLVPRSVVLALIALILLMAKAPMPVVMIRRMAMTETILARMESLDSIENPWGHSDPLAVQMSPSGGGHRRLG